MSAQPLQRVLYVEDDEDVQRIVRVALERLGGMTLELVSDSSKAMEAIIDFKPDLVVLDWMMPRIDGLALFRKMRELPETATLPVVFLTAHAHWSATDKLIALGAAGVITKPFSATDLAEQLRQIWKSLP